VVDGIVVDGIVVEGIVVVLFGGCTLVSVVTGGAVCVVGWLLLGSVTTCAAAGAAAPTMSARAPVLSAVFMISSFVAGCAGGGTATINRVRGGKVPAAVAAARGVWLPGHCGKARRTPFAFPTSGL
jgi:hypothetical protein